jgi:hypothetical protein
MLAVTGSEVAMIIGAVAGLVVATAVAVLIYRKGFDRFDVKVGAMQASLKAVEKNVQDINTAVNHVPLGSPTLVQRVVKIEEAVHKIAIHVGCDLNNKGTMS